MTILEILLAMMTDIMHLVMNLSSLLISLWCGTIDIAPSDDINTRDWAVLRIDEYWQAHSQAVEHAGSFLPGSYNQKPHNIAEKLTSGYKTWEFQLHTFSLSPALLYGVLPAQYWMNYCKLVHDFQIMSQHCIKQEDHIAAHVLLCNWEQEFKQLYYQLHEDHLHFIQPCVHQVNHLMKEAVLKGLPICYVQWMMERTIRNLGRKIRQPACPYANLSQEGVQCCKVNVLLAAMPELEPPLDGLPPMAVDLEGGYVLLPKCNKDPVNSSATTTTAIARFLGDNHPVLHIQQWA